MNVDTWRIGAVALVITAVIAYAVLSGVWVGTDSTWYQSLEQPSWQPPPWVFGVIWPYNFIALTVVAAVVVWQSTGFRVSVLLIFLVASIAMAVAWAYSFYVPHELATAAIALSAAVALTVPIVVIAFLTGPVWGVLLLPYQVWLALAASLSWGYVRLHG
ncbi:MAG: tryptophan-rich sensory protein [Actinomycetota bacterium]|nr:tryptophan-rich sensory protein [Actinomycetota bacterium]